MRDIHKWKLEQLEQEIVKRDIELDKAHKRYDKLNSDYMFMDKQIWQWKLAYEKVLVELLTGKKV